MPLYFLRYYIKNSLGIGDKVGMGMKHLWVFLPLIVWGSEDFISDYEYGEMLFANPRGVSCSQCHGESGQGKTIVEYRDIHGKQLLKGADIRQKTLAEMITAVNSYHKIMPRYYLTDEEVKAIYNYLKIKNQNYLLECDEDNRTR